MEERKTKSMDIVVEDDRFKSVDSNRFLNKPPKKSGNTKESVPGLVNPKIILKKSLSDKRKLLSVRKEGKNKRTR